MWVRKVAGWTIILAGSGLAAISGVLAYHGFEAMISIPYAGMIGPFVAICLIGLGIAVESEIRLRRWIGAAILGALLIGAGLLDRHSGELALKAKVEAAAQANADRLAAYETASKALTDAQASVKSLEADLAIMTGSDVFAAQRLLGVKEDGKKGPDTIAAFQRKADEIRADLVPARADVRKHTETVGHGAPAAELPFSLSDAALYASLITLLSIVLAFAGSYVAHGVTVDPEKELDRIEEAASEIEFALGDYLNFLGARVQNDPLPQYVN